jgi:hypothetical protein
VLFRVRWPERENRASPVREEFEGGSSTWILFSRESTMITYVKGHLFESTAQVLTNAFQLRWYHGSGNRFGIQKT